MTCSIFSLPHNLCLNLGSIFPSHRRYDLRSSFSSIWKYDENILNFNELQGCSEATCCRNGRRLITFTLKTKLSAKWFTVVSTTNTHRRHSLSHLAITTLSSSLKGKVTLSGALTDSETFSVMARRLELLST